MRRVAFFTFTIAVLSSHCLASGQLADLLVRQNQSTLELIHSFDVEFDAFESLECMSLDPVAMRRMAVPRHDLSCRWMRRTPCERLEYVCRSMISTNKGFPLDAGVFSTNGTTVRILKNWNPEKPPRFQRGNQGPIKAMESPHTANPSGFPNVRAFFLFEHARGMMANPMPLEDVIDSFENVVADKIVTEGNSSELYRIVAAECVEHPQILSYEVILDPTVGYLARKSVARVLDERVGVRITTREVTQFRTLGEGVFFPVEATQTTEHPKLFDAPMSESMVRVTELAVNEPLGDDAFSLPFPKDLVVHVFKGGINTHELWLWGENDTPLRHIKTSKELEDLSRGQASGRWTGWLLFSACVLAVSIMAWQIVSYRRRRG